MNNQGGLGGVGGGGGGSRVSIPENAKKTIQSIREITGKQHSDEEIYSVLKECSMDPNETAQKLLYLDTFHEVKRKRVKKKETTSVQGRGGRGSRGNYYTSTGKDAGGGRNASGRRENRGNNTSDRGSAPLLAVQKVENNAISQLKKTTTAIPNGTTTLPNGSSSYVSKLAVNEVNGETKDGLPANKPTTISVQTDAAEPPATIPAQSYVSLISGKVKSVSNINGSSSSSTSATVSGVYSSASDPVLVPTVAQHAGVVGTIKCVTGRQQEAAEISNIQGNIPVDIDVSKIDITASEVPIPMHGNSASSKSKAEQVKQSNSLESTLLQAVTSDVAALTVEANSQSLADSNVPNDQHVTFPSHFQVSENGLTFGSFGASFGLVRKRSNVAGEEINSASPVETSTASDEPAREPSSRSQAIVPTAEGVDANQPQSPRELEEVPEPEGNITSDAELKVGRSTTQELHLHPEGIQYVIPNAPSYGFGLMPASTNHIAQVDGPEAWAHDVSRLANFSGGNSSVPSGTSTPPLQSSAAAAPQAVHLFRQPYPHNFFPYSYLHPFYMHAMHQYLNMAGIPQQPSTGNLYMPPGAASPGVKLPFTQVKPGTNAGNPVHYTIPSGYGPMTPPAVGFNFSVPSVTSGTSSSKDDFAASQLKENHIYTTGPLNEGLPVWMAAPGQDYSNLSGNPLQWRSHLETMGVPGHP